MRTISTSDCRHVTISTLKLWHVTTNIHPWVLTCDNQYPLLSGDMWQYSPLRPPQFPCSGSSSVAGRQAAKPGPISVLGPAKNMPGHRTLAVTVPRRHQRRLRTHYGCIYAMLWWVGSWVCGVRAALQDYHCPDFLVSIPQCPMEIFMPGCSGEIINFPDFLDNNFQYLDVRQSGTECMCSRNIIKYKN